MITGPRTTQGLKTTLHRRLLSKGDVDIFVAEIVRCKDIHTARNIAFDLMTATTHYVHRRSHRSKREQRVAVIAITDAANPEDVVARRMIRNKLIDKNLTPR